MKKNPLILLLLSPLFLFGQSNYNGPAFGTVAGGITKNTFDVAGVPEQGNPIEGLPTQINQGLSNGKPLLSDNTTAQTQTSNQVRINEKKWLQSSLDFDGPSAMNCWVPDCNVIPGPSDMLLAINTRFWITDKDGNIISDIGTNAWFADFIGTGLVFDPKCIYDPSAERFIMTYLYYESVSDSSLMLICVSDDETAAGDWNIWAMPGDLNGMVHEDVFPDFPTLTITDSLIYWLNDMYPYNPPTGNPLYTKLRVIKKNDVFNSTAGNVDYQDIWGIKRPNSNLNVRTLKLVHNLSPSTDVYMVGLPNPSGGTFASIYGYKIKDSFNELSVSAFNIPCSSYSMPPHMLHQGGGKRMQLWWFFYTEMVQRNGKIRAAHSVRGANPNYSQIHFMEIDTGSMSLVQELYLNKTDYAYGYPDMLIDDQDNVFMVYNRSGLNEYPGIFYTAKPANSDSFLDDIPLQEGQGDLNGFCGNTSNPYIRFEDYTDIMFDPVEANSFWMMGEYIGADNRWKTKVGKVAIDDFLPTATTPGNLTAAEMQIIVFPNPFYRSTIIRYNLAQTSDLKISLVDSHGSVVTNIFEGSQESGQHEVYLNREDLPGGIYQCVFQTAQGVYVERLIIIE
ncbi:MAG: hypothetical protein DHS20C18_34410 [Saprospiraceae bacterium]|nr:MAG: hypothetical protein DHS20C18_34410 [Saprospiraceae bacterium]